MKRISGVEKMIFELIIHPPICPLHQLPAVPSWLRNSDLTLDRVEKARMINGCT